MRNPLGRVVEGGIMLAPVLILILLPVPIDWFSRRGVEQDEMDASLELAE